MMFASSDWTSRPSLDLWLLILLLHMELVLTISLLLERLERTPQVYVELTQAITVSKIQGCSK